MRDFDVAGAFDFNGDQSLRPAEFWIRINQDGHDASIDDVDQSVAVRNDLHLVPLAGFDRGFEIIGAAQSCEQSRLLARFSCNHLTTPCDDSTRRTLFVELAGVLVVVVEIRLVAANIPLGVLAVEFYPLLPLFLLLRSQVVRRWSEVRLDMIAAVLQTAVGASS